MSDYDSVCLGDRSKPESPETPDVSCTITPLIQTVWQGLLSG